MRMKRLCLALAFAVCASFSSATLLQSWNKSVTVSGEVPIFQDVKVDSTGNVYAYGTVEIGGNNDVVVIKYSPAGATLWTNRIALAGDQSARNLLIDGSGNLYIDFSTRPTISQSDVQLRKLRSTDGGTIGTLNYADPEVIEVNFGRLTVDQTGQVYWSYLETQIGSPFSDVYQIVRVNSSNMALSTKTPLVVPAGFGLMQTKPRPGGGLVMLIAKSLDGTQPLDGRRHSSSLYEFVPTTGLRQITLGSASTFVLNAEGSFFGLGAHDGGLGFSTVLSTWGTLGGQIDSGYRQTMDADNPYFRDAVYTKNKRIIGVGAIDGGSGRAEDCLMTQQIVEMGHIFQISSVVIGTNLNEVFDSIQLDGFFGLSAVENNGNSDNGRIHELDEISCVSVDSRPLNYFVRAHAVNASGLIATAGNEGGVTLMRPRDMKDIYMGSTTIRGGLSATLNVRMYESHTVNRTVNLTDNSANVSMPATRVINAGTTIGNVVVTTTAVASPQVVTITAAYGSQRRIFTLTVTP